MKDNTLNSTTMKNQRFLSPKSYVGSMCFFLLMALSVWMGVTSEAKPLQEAVQSETAAYAMDGGIFILDIQDIG